MASSPLTPIDPQAMGFDVLDGDRDDETNRNRARWRETEEEARKAAGGQRGIEQEEEEEQDGGQLPEPDAEGRRMAESEEVSYDFVFFACFSFSGCFFSKKNGVRPFLTGPDSSSGKEQNPFSGKIRL